MGDQIQSSPPNKITIHHRLCGCTVSEVEVNRAKFRSNAQVVGANTAFSSRIRRGANRKKLDKDKGILIRSPICLRLTSQVMKKSNFLICSSEEIGIAHSGQYLFPIKVDEPKEQLGISSSCRKRMVVTKLDAHVCVDYPLLTQDVMDPNSSLGKFCFGENVVEISSDKVEGSGDWNSPEFQDTANSRQKKETKAMVSHQMDTEEVSDRFVAPCFVNGLEAYDGEINLGVEENMISNEYAVKLCLEHEVKRGNKIVKKDLIVALRGEIYFVKFIINQEEDDVEPGVIFRRSFIRMTKAIADFGAGIVIIYPEFDPFLEDIEEEKEFA
ncbi:hypothetical protein Tco_1491506 [Tanacetum coccineum]